MLERFGDIANRCVLRVLARSADGNISIFNGLSAIESGTLQDSAMRSTRSIEEERGVHSGTLGTRSNSRCVPEKTSETATVRVERAGTRTSEVIRYDFNEKAGILEYDGLFANEEAELMAFKECLVQYVSEAYPDIETEYRMIIYPTFEEMDNAARQ